MMNRFEVFLTPRWRVTCKGTTCKYRYWTEEAARSHAALSNHRQCTTVWSHRKMNDNER